MCTESFARGERTTCEECGLPYYADANDACPYCATATETETESESTVEQPAGNPQTEPRSRTTCEECGLAYYADANESCPYCERAAGGAPSEADTSSGEQALGDRTETEPEPDATTEPEPETSTAESQSSEAEPSLLRRLSNKVRAVLTS